MISVHSLYLFLICTDNLSQCSIRFAFRLWRFSLLLHVTFWGLAHKQLRSHRFSFDLTVYSDHPVPPQPKRAPWAWVCVNLNPMKTAACSIFVTAWIKHIKYWESAGRKDGVLALTVPRKCLLCSHMILGLSRLTEINTQAREEADDAQPWSDVLEHFNLWWTYCQCRAMCVAENDDISWVTTSRLNTTARVRLAWLGNLCPRKKGIMGDWRSCHLLSRSGFWQH